MGLALVAALRGYQCVFVMPDKMSQEKVASLRAFGARVVICPTAVEPEDPRSYYQVAKRIVQETPGAYYANQYHNPANPEAHYLSTAPEIWAQTGGEVDVFVAGMGTGGTISGCGRYLQREEKGLSPGGRRSHRLALLRVRQDRPHDPPVLLLRRGHRRGLPAQTMNLKILDEIIRVDDKECFLMTRELVRQEGLYVGGSSGAAVAGAIRYAEMTKRKENILVLLPDGAQKYLSKIFDDKWMRENGFLDEPDLLGTVSQLLRSQEAAPAGHRQDGRARARRHRAHARQRHLAAAGARAERAPGRHRRRGRPARTTWSPTRAGSTAPSTTLIESDYATVTPADAGPPDAQHLQRRQDRGRRGAATAIAGVITKIDLIEYLAERRRIVV